MAACIKLIFNGLPKGADCKIVDAFSWFTKGQSPKANRQPPTANCQLPTAKSQLQIQPSRFVSLLGFAMINQGFEKRISSNRGTIANHYQRLSGAG